MITDIFASLNCEPYRELVTVLDHGVASGEVCKGGHRGTLEKVREVERAG